MDAWCDARAITCHRRADSPPNLEPSAVQRPPASPGPQDSHTNPARKQYNALPRATPQSRHHPVAQGSGVLSEMHQMPGSIDSTLQLLDLADEGRFPLMSHVW